MGQRSSVKIPEDRVGVLIGPDGIVRKRIENVFDVSLNIDSESGNVEITLVPGARDPSAILKVQNIVKAIGYGFNPERAEKLADEEFDLIIIDLVDYAGRSNPDTLKRLRSRIIGKDGRSREQLEELTDTMIGVHGGTVSIIGRIDKLEVAREAVLMLLRGAFHKTVWNYINAQRRRMKRDQINIWKEQPKSRADLR